MTTSSLARRKYSIIRRRNFVYRVRHALGRHGTAHDNCSDEKVAVDNHAACNVKGGWVRVFYDPMPKFVGRFRNEKSNPFLKDLPRDGGPGSELDPRNVAWAGSIQCKTFVKTLQCSFP